MPKITQLTPKMVKFCECIVSGLMPVDSYKAAYNAENMQENTIRREAYNLMQRDDITAYINNLRKPLQNYQINTSISESERIKNELWSMINNPDTKDENRLRAMDILNRMNGSYNNTDSETENKDSLQDLDTKQLTDILKAV